MNATAHYQEPVIKDEQHEIFAHYEHYTTEEEAAILAREDVDGLLAQRFGRTVKAILIKRYNMEYPRYRYEGGRKIPVIQATSAGFVAPAKPKKERKTTARKYSFISEAELQAEMEAGEN